MFGSGVLDTAIGLVFVFLLVSMLVTIANEMIAGAFLSRAKWLRTGVERLLDAEWAQKLYDHPLIEGSSSSAGSGPVHRFSPFGNGPSYIPSRAFANVLVDMVRNADSSLADAARSLNRALGELPWPPPAGEAAPGVAQLALCRSRLEPAIAALPGNAVGTAVRQDLQALLQRLEAVAMAGTAADPRAELQRFIDAMPSRYLREMIQAFPGDKVRRTLLLLLDDAAMDELRFKQNVEIWFNNAMDRVGGWYKRRSQWVIAVLAIAVTVITNVDAILIVRHLETHPGVRDALVAQARLQAAGPPPLSSAAAASAAASAVPAELIGESRSVQAQLEQLSLPVGWVRKASAKSEIDGHRVLPDLTFHAVFDALAFHGLGWLLTALAATLGAPFWFDMLNRIISIRSAGKAPEDKPKPPRDVPAPLEPGQSPQQADLMAALKR